MSKDYLSVKAADMIRSSIINGDLQIGEPLSEQKISKKFNLSKTPVREALSILVHEGLIQKHSRRGSFVFEITINEIEEIAEYRFILELYALKKSLEINKKGLVEVLSKNITEQKKASKQKDYNKFLILDTEFHKSFFKYFENITVLNSYNIILNKSQALRVKTLKDSVDDGSSLEGHINILKVIKENKILDETLSKHLVEWVAKYRSNYKIRF